MSLPLQFSPEPRRKARITLLASCSNTKTSEVDPDLRARTLQSRGVDQRAEEWISRLLKSDAPTLPATDLYGGDHWSTMRILADYLERTNSVSLKILSAGYGLIDANTRIRSYSATFSPQSPDLVAKGPASRRWWTLVNTSPAPWMRDSEPQTISDVAASNPSSTFVVVASRQYLQAIASDLQNAATRLASPTRLLIFSAGSPAIPKLDNHVVGFDSRLRRLVGGSDISLNARVAAHVLKSLAPDELDVASASASLERVSAGLEPIERPARRPLTDEEILEFIARDSQSVPNTSATASLRRLRAQGFACEQSRFHTLFKEAAHGVN